MASKTDQKAKRRQHYVWRYYLTAWEDKGSVHCWRDGKVFKANPVNLGVEAYFYDLRDLDDADETMIQDLIGASAPHVQSIAAGWHEVFTKPKRLAEAMGLWPGLLQGKVEEIPAAASELEEELHCLFEEVGKPLLDSLREGNVPSPADMFELLPFLTTQYTRTKAIEEAIRRSTGGKVARIWQVMRHVYASNMAIGILRGGEFKADILRAPEGQYFITGDQPIINTQGIWNPDGTAPTDLELYYPVSPGLALLISKSAAWVERAITQIESNTRNASMAKAAHSQVYAQRVSDLEHVTSDRKVS